jgi:hypothetical protein
MAAMSFDFIGGVGVLVDPALEWGGMRGRRLLGRRAPKIGGNRREYK